jgi:hypothetical protein
MNLVPPSVIAVLDKRTGHSNVGADRRDGRVVAEGAACGPRVGLRDSPLPRNRFDVDKYTGADNARK